MHGEEILTEYFENAMEEEEQARPRTHEDVVVLESPVEPDHQVIEVFEPEPETLGEDAYVVSFSEDDMEYESSAITPESLEEVSFEEELPSEMGADELPGTEEASVEDTRSYIPGSTAPIEEEVVEEEPRETNWADDRDPSKFLDYLREAYEEGIPKHTGDKIGGCERALVYLNRLNREVSEAVRRDSDNVLDEHLDEIDDYRVKILQGMVALKNRIGELKKKIREEGSQKKVSEDLADMITKESVETEDEITKEATTAQIQMVITPFERAITGILVNSVVSAGHPFEEVYDYLKEKFDLTPREELAVLQIVMDMGFPIFKDRGTIGGDATGDKEGHGVDFLKNYFA